MALVYECTTELDAVNAMLGMVGEQPVNELTDTEVSMALIAQKTLHRFNRKIQAKGLNCNTEQNYKFLPDVSDEIPLPSNTLEVINAQGYDTLFVREGKLYDAYEQSFTFTNPIYADLVLFLQFEQLPQHIREYVMMLAARRFISDTVGDKELLEQTNQDFVDAKAEFLRIEIKNQKNNILASPDTYHTVNRRA